MAELADARDLKSLGGQLPYRFDSGQRHHISGDSRYLLIAIRLLRIRPYARIYARSVQGFAFRFLQTPPRSGSPCGSANGSRRQGP